MVERTADEWRSPVLGLQQTLKVHEAHQEALNVFWSAEKSQSKIIKIIHHRCSESNWAFFLTEMEKFISHVHVLEKSLCIECNMLPLHHSLFTVAKTFSILWERHHSRLFVSIFHSSFVCIFVSFPPLLLLQQSNFPHRDHHLFNPISRERCCVIPPLVKSATVAGERVGNYVIKD